MPWKKSTPAVCVEAAGVRVEAEPGRIRFDIEKLLVSHGDEFMHRLLDRALRVETIRSVAIDRSRRSVTIEYDARTGDLCDTLQGIAGSLRGERPPRLPDIDVAIDFSGVVGSVTRVDRVHQLAAEMTPRTRAVLHGLVVHYAPLPGAADDFYGKIHEDSTAGRRPETPGAIGPACDSGRPGVATGLAKLANLAAAGGCFALSIVGVVMPGIPTLPFVLATSYFLVRSTPELNERFRRSWLFGQLVRDWEDSGGLRRTTKVRAIALMFVLLGVTLPTVSSLPLLALTVAVATVDVCVVLHLPTIPDEKSPRLLAWQPA